MSVDLLIRLGSRHLRPGPTSSEDIQHRYQEQPGYETEEELGEPGRTCLRDQLGNRLRPPWRCGRLGWQITGGNSRQIAVIPAEDTAILYVVDVETTLDVLRAAYDPELHKHALVWTVRVEHSNRPRQSPPVSGIRQADQSPGSPTRTYAVSPSRRFERYRKRILH